MRSKWISAFVALAALAIAPNAGAFERQWHVGGGLGVASFVSSDLPMGPALGLHGAYGLSDMFDVRLELTGSRHEQSDGSSLDLYSATAGITYKIDVIEWIPYAGLLVGYYWLGGENPPPDSGALGISTALGIDYALSRSFALGLQIRYHGNLNDPPTSLGYDDRFGSYFTGFLRAEYRWGW